MILQKGISAGNDVAGRDIIDNSQNNVNILYLHKKTQLEGLIESLREQIESDPAVAEFVEALQDWIMPKKTELTRDLAKKLSDCGKDYLIEDALEAKERFTKQLKKTTFNPAVQQIYACILGEIYIYFNHRIKPKISAETPRGVTESDIADLADVISGQLASAPPSLGVGVTEIVGMLYFLTGNCHINWDYNDSLSSSS